MKTERKITLEVIEILANSNYVDIAEDIYNFIKFASRQLDRNESTFGYLNDFLTIDKYCDVDGGIEKAKQLIRTYFDSLINNISIV